MEKLIVGICDDNEIWRNHIKESCDEWMQQNNMECEYKIFTCGQEVLDYTNEPMLLLFLDIEMPDMTGIEVMERMVDSEKIWRIVFVSNHKEAVFSSFGLKTLGFVIKHEKNEEIQHWLEVSIGERDDDRIIQFDEKCVLPLSQIKYIEANKNYIDVYTIRDRKVFVGNLKTWEAKISSKCMLRCHKSYLVNMDFIENIVRGKVFFSDERFIPIGDTYKNIVREKYNNYIMKKVRRRIC